MHILGGCGSQGVIDPTQSGVVHLSSSLHQNSPMKHHYRSATQLLQEYLAHTKLPPPKDFTKFLCLWPYGGPRGQAFSHERGTPVG